MRLLLSLMGFLILLNQKDDSSLIDEIFALLEEGDENIDFRNKTDFIVLLGLSGSGKSTLAHYMSGDPDTISGYDYYGQLLYNDTEGSIGGAGIISYTLFPEVTLDLQYGDAVVDNPGFEDTRNSSFEIAASYFIKKVFDTSTSVKLVLTISNAGVRPGQDRHMLNDLLNNMIQLVVDIDKYEESFSMVVTKVPVNSNTDSQEIDYIKRFLNDDIVNNYENLLEQATDPVEIAALTNKLKILSILLNENTNKIVVFRAPEKVGPISQSEYSLENKNNIRIVVFDTTQYVPTSLGDFDYAVSPATETFIRDEIYDEINSKVANMINLITSQVTDRILYIGERSESLLNLKEEIDYIYHLIWDVNIGVANRDTLQNLVDNCINYLNSFSSAPISSEDFSNLLDQFEFFRSFTDKLDDPYSNWIQLFMPLRSFSRYLYDWYVTLVSMHDVAGRPDVQKVKNDQFDPAFLDMSYTVAITDVQDFLQKVKFSKLTDYPDELEEIIYNNTSLFKDFTLRDIDTVLNLIRPNITCFSDLYTVRSNFVSISSDIASHINVNCTNVTSFKIMAYEKLYIDTGLDLHDSDISMIALNWEIASAFKLDLSGSDGLKHDPPKAPNSDSERRYNGKMGLPGNPGGYFIGIAQQVVRSDLLSIVLNGGSGSKGQDGGDGVNTEDNPHKISNTYYNNDIPELERQCREWSYECEREGSNKDFTNIHHDIYKKNQQLAGSGGRSGYAGFSGKFDFTVLNDTIESSISLQNGSLGDYGRGGSGWKLGDVTSHCKLEAIPIIGAGLTIHCTVRSRTSKTSYKEADDVSALDEYQPSQRPVPSFNTINDIIELKFQYLEHQMLIDVVSPIITLTNDTNILSFYNIRAFLDEFLLLELKKYDLNPVLFDIYANTLLPVVDTWPTSTEEDKQVMVFLTATLSSMIWSVQMDNGTTFVTDLYSYVQTALKTIEDLNVLNMIEATENIKDNYADSMSSNIVEAQNYIAVFIDKVFEDIFTDIAKTTDALIKEIEVLKQDIEQNIVKLREKERQLGAQMVGNAIFGVINVAAQALKLAGPAGTAAGIALGAASSISQDLIVGGVTIDGMHPTNLPAGVHNLLSDLEKLRQSRKEGHMETILYCCDSYLTIPDITEGNKSKILEINERALTISGITDLEEADTIIQGCIGDLQVSYNEVDPGEDQNTKKLVENNKSILDYASKTSQIAGSLLDGIRQYKNDQDKIETIVDMIEQEQESLDYLSDFEEAVYQVIFPMIDTLHREMSTLEDELNNQSSVSLIVKQWEITMYINELTYLIARYTEGFAVQADFIRYFNQLNEAANLVVTLYEQIQYYQEHIFFAGYIADLNSVGGGVIPENSQYTPELVALKKQIVSSDVRVQCHAIITSFTQQIFPFAKLHLGSLNVPNNKFCEGDDQTVVNTINTVEKELDKIRDTIMDNKDQFVHIGRFDSTYVSTPPFALWDSNTYGDEINRLMIGEEISIMAPIIGQKNAVKFNRIQIRFNRTDGGSQEELTNALKTFTIEQTHFGNSLYQCDEYKFLIRTQPLTLTYTLENDANGNPVIVNNVYSKLVSGDISLSPYTMWRLKLTETYSKAGIFDKLLPFTNNNVNMELYGTGQFVDRYADVCRTRLGDYYEFDKPMINSG